MSNTRWPSVPEPDLTSGGIYNTVMSLKMSMELLTGQRGFDPSYSVDTRFETVSKSLNNLSATVSRQITVAVNDNSALAERVELVEAEIEAARDGEASLNARIVEVDTASVSRDGAIATALEQVSAQVDDVSAGGFFKTTASVTGGTTLASMEAQVFTTTAHTGTLTAGWRVQIVGGVSYFDMYAANWRLIDPTGTPKQVMSYYDGLFHFTGNVAIDGNLVVTGSVHGYKLIDLSLTNVKIADANVDYRTIGANATSSAAAASGNTNVSCYIYARAGSSVVVVCDVGPGGGNSDNCQMYVNGGLARDITRTGMWSGGIETGTNVTNAAPLNYSYVAGYTGTHTIQVICSGIGVGIFVMATELAR